MSPDLPGAGRHFVYFLCARAPGHDPEHRLVYVYIGVTSNLSARMRAHSRKWWWRALDHDLTAFVECDTRDAANALEAASIHEHQPEMNRAGRLLVVR